jgi:Creatinine amidohydrolase
MPHLMPGLTTEEVRARKAAGAVLPVGSFEQHGPYLPLITDTDIACIIAKGILDASPVRRLPPVTISCSHEHKAWPGTVSIVGLRPIGQTCARDAVIAAVSSVYVLLARRALVMLSLLLSGFRCRIFVRAAVRRQCHVEERDRAGGLAAAGVWLEAGFGYAV